MEMTIEQKAKAYDEALERAKELLEVGLKDTRDKRVVLSFFPELVESEDERIKKELLAVIDDLILPKEQKERFIAWLEKHGEHAKFRDSIQVGDNVTRNKDCALVNLSQLNRVAKKDEKQGDDKVEPKFKVGDWIIDVQGVSTNQIIGYEDGSYLIKTSCSQFYLPIKLTEKNYHLWTIQDAKDGDVLTYVTDEEDLWIMIYWSLYEPYEGHVHYHALLINDNFGDKGTCSICVDNLKPATKKQRELLFKKMHEAGYEWDAEKKELKKVDQKPNLDVEIPFGTDSELVEEAITIPDGCYAIIEDNKVILRKGEKKSSWGEEDKAMLNLIIARLHSHPNVDLEEYSKEYDWLNYGLRSLRHQSAWKPSGEQMDALHYVTNFDYGGHKATLVSLYEQLMKLKG